MATNEMIPTAYKVVRSSCKHLIDGADDAPVKIDTAAADAFADALDIPSVQAFGASLASDVNFTGTSCDYQSNMHEATFILLLHALDFGSGWRKELHAHHGKGAFLTIKPGVEAIFQDSPTLTARFLEEETGREKIASWFNLIGEDGIVPDNLESLIDLIQLVLQELGRQCRAFGSLEIFLADTLSRVSSGETPAGDLVMALVNQFPETFDDKHTIPLLHANAIHSERTVFFYKKAQLVVGEIYHRFQATDPIFRFPDGPELTAYVDNVICAALRYTGIVVPNDSITNDIENGVDLPKGSAEEVFLRACALMAIEYIVERVRARGTLSANELGNYLWGGLGKEPAVRKFQRHATKTVFY